MPLSLSDVDDDDAAFFGPTTEDEDRAFFEAPATADDDEFFDAACDEDDAAAAAGYGLDILELRAVYAAVKDVAFDNDPRGDKAAWRANARRKLAELVDKERKGALLPNEARRPEYRHVGAFDLELPAPPHVDDDARARASTAA